MGTDAMLKKCAKRNHTRTPHDVLRREAVLDEHAITQRNGGRRLSTVVLQPDGDLSNSNGSDGGDIELSNVASSRGLHSNPMRGTPVNLSIDDELNQIKEELKDKTRKIEAQAREMESLKKTVALLMKHVSYTPSSTGEVKVDDPPSTSISIKDTAPTKMHRNPNWKRLKKSVKATNSFKTSSRKRAKRLSQVMKSRRNSALKLDAMSSSASATPVVSNNIQTHVDEDTGRRYSYNMTTGDSSWLDEEK